MKKVNTLFIAGREPGAFLCCSKAEAFLSSCAFNIGATNEFLHWPLRPSEGELRAKCKETQDDQHCTIIKQSKYTNESQLGPHGSGIGSAGKLTHSGVYLKVQVNGKYVAFHKQLKEDDLGMKIDGVRMHVHPKDKNEKNNRLENLEVMRKQDHLKEHAREGGRPFGKRKLQWSAAKRIAYLRLLRISMCGHRSRNTLSKHRSCRWCLQRFGLTLCGQLSTKQRQGRSAVPVMIASTRICHL